MSAAFEFISHESFPEDDYTKEAVILCIGEKHRVTYVRKKLQTGAMFWDVISATVKAKGGEKKYLKSYSQDSNFLHDDIKYFLESRSWEKLTNKVGGTVLAEKSEMQDSFPF